MEQALDRTYSHAKKPFIEVLKGKPLAEPPFWYMRQAGRYLPEYRETRAEAGSFLDLCFNPDLATEVTLQPLRRYDMDAAILFSDILIIPHGLGQTVSFKEGVGPVLAPFNIDTLSFDRLHEVSAPVYQTVRQISEALEPEKALIGFAGAPWTVATYMIEGGSSREFLNIREMMYKTPAKLEQLMEILVEATSAYLLKQIEAGAEVIQIFDSWASVLPEEMFEKWVIQPTQKIVSNLHAAHPDIPVIGFPKGAGILYPAYAEKTGVTAVSLDHCMPIDWAVENIQSICPVQGCLDPMLLLAGGDVMLDGAKKILDGFSKGPFIFNLGHGIHKDTPPSHVQDLSDFLNKA